MSTTVFTERKLRADLKALGYQLKIQTFSFGRMASVYHIERGCTSGDVLPADEWHHCWDKWVEYATANRADILSLEIPGLTARSLARYRPPES
jgi:hypothetical protein